MLIQVEKLSFAYPGVARAAVTNLDFAVDRGEIFGFLGPSGAGKSTTQKILIGLLKAYHGEARVFGRDLADWGSDYYERIGVSFEFPNHYLKLSGIENLRYFAALYGRRGPTPEALLAAVDLGDAADLRVSQYSKGMKTRLGVARALLNDPELLFLDEPTAGLDPANARLVKGLIAGQRAAGKTVFLTTHDMGAVDELCDRAAFIDAGEIRLIDRPQDLKLRYGSKRVAVEHRANGRVEKRLFDLDGLAENREFIAILRAGAVETMHTQEATLDEIFIQVTGRSLR